MRNQHRAAVVVAHPDDETLWAGGTILTHPEWDWSVVALCRESDPDRAPRFRDAVARLGGHAFIGDLDDGPEQAPLPPGQVRAAVRALLPDRAYHVVLTHSVRGEYTRHRRHEETGAAVADLWYRGDLTTRRLWMFAYEDGGQGLLPRAVPDADRHVRLRRNIWRRKYGIVTDTYGFAPDSWEARTTPEVEGFWCFRDPEELRRRRALLEREDS
jgi:LmbE family N-acetylglucosaminyl deacetylase